MNWKCGSPLACSPSSEQRAAREPVDVGLGVRLADQQTAQLACQERLAAGPVEHPLQHARDVVLRQADGGDQRSRLLRLEIVHFNANADVERGVQGVLDQLGRRRDADQREGKAGESGLDGAQVVHRPDGGEEVVGEIESERRIDFVDEDDDATGSFRQDDFAEIGDEAVAEGQRAAAPIPPVVKIGRRRAGRFDTVEDAEVPALGIAA